MNYRTPLIYIYPLSAEMPNSTASDFDGSLSNEPKRIEDTIGSNDDGNSSVNELPTTSPTRSLPVGQLYTIVAAVSLAGFLYSLDITIIATVSYPPYTIEFLKSTISKANERISIFVLLTGA